MKNWKKYAFASASVVALAAGLAACGNLTGNSKKAADSGDKPVIKMYQIGDKPDNLDELLANANKIIEEKVGAKLDIQYLGWGDYGKKMSVITSSGENYDIAFADNYIVNAQKGAYADLTELYKKEGKDLYKALDPAYIKGNTVNGKIYAVPVAANVASSQNFAFNGTLLAKYGIDISGVTSYETLEPVLKQIKEKAPDVVPFAIGKVFIPSDNFDYPVANGLPFVIDLEGDTTKVVNRYEVARFTICQGIFNPIFFSRENLKSFLEADGLAQFEARVRAVQETDAYFARVSFYQDGEGKVHGVYHLAQGVKTVLPREPFVPAAYMEQLVDKEVQWEIDLVQITGDGSKPEDYESIARLDYAKFLEVLPPSFYHQLDANQIEIQPILGQDFKTLAQEK